MKRIIISERKTNILFSLILNESLGEGHMSDKVLQIKDYLDKNFTKASSDNGTLNTNGEIEKKSLVALLDDSKNVIKLLTDRQLFDILQERFKTILPNNSDKEKKNRDNFLKKVLIAWYHNNITKEGSVIEKN